MDAISLYNQTTLECSKLITERYSTSFTLGIKTLDKSLHLPIYAIYGFVRYADEIVDTFHDQDKQALLDRFKKDTYDVLVLCKDQVDVTDVHAVWEVLAHEATHIMQACTPGGDTAFRNEDHPAMIDDIKRIAPDDIDLIVNAYEKHEWKGELEAFWMMRQDPTTVIDYLRQICAR